MSVHNITEAFVGFPKIARFSREVIVTEKIDGTNAQILISENAGKSPEPFVAMVGNLFLWAGSRNRFVQPGKLTDNAGFAGWVRDNAAELVNLGVGRHFGEWWGKGIQRSYGIPEKRFSLFNVNRWHGSGVPSCCSVVPVLYRGLFDSDQILGALDLLEDEGSVAAPGFMDAEGIIIYHTAANMMFKATIADDELPKSLVTAIAA